MALGLKPSQSAIFLLQQIQSKALDPKKMTRRQREVCVRHLLNEYKYSQQEIAGIVGCVRETVSHIRSRILKQDSWMLDDVDERKIAVDLMQKAEMCFTKLVKKEKYKEAWNVEKEKVEVLQSLGYVTHEPIKIEGQITLLELLKRANQQPAGQFISDSQRRRFETEEELAAGNGNGSSHGLGTPEAGCGSN